MLARCARCQSTFTTGTFGLQKCPHCGAELILADPNAPPPKALPTEAAVPPGGSGHESGASPPPPPPPFAFGIPPGSGGPPGGPPLEPEELPAPFAERQRLGFFPAYFETWKLAATRPQEFFRRVRIDQTGSAVLFGVISGVLGSVFQSLYSWVGREQLLIAFRHMMDKFPADQAQVFQQILPYLSGSGPVVGILLSPLSALIGIYLVAGVVHLLLMLFRAAGRGFGATLTTVGYGYAVMVLLAVPACGGLVALVWLAVVLVTGLAESQRCGTGKSALAVFLPLVLACCCCGGAATLGVLSVLKAFGGATRGGPVDL